QDVPGEKYLVAYIVLQPESIATISELRRFLKERLPEYMVPSATVMLSALPLTPNGKIDRKALPAPTGFQNEEMAQNYVAPHTEIEQTIATVWQQALRLEKVGVHDNFFDLGGHSLLIAQVYSQLQKLLDEKLLIVELFQYSTINSLANYLSSEQRKKTFFEQSHQQVNKQKDAINRHKERLLRQKHK
ncbi:MAG: phosphopantetheine-binding protein, partial [Crinalium sp.]